MSHSHEIVNIIKNQAKEKKKSHKWIFSLYLFDLKSNYPPTVMACGNNDNAMASNNQKKYFIETSLINTILNIFSKKDCKMENPPLSCHDESFESNQQDMAHEIKLKKNLEEPHDDDNDIFPNVGHYKFENINLKLLDLPSKSVFLDISKDNSPPITSTNSMTNFTPFSKDNNELSKGKGGEKNIFNQSSSTLFDRNDYHRDNYKEGYYSIYDYELEEDNEEGDYDNEKDDENETIKKKKRK